MLANRLLLTVAAVVTAAVLTAAVLAPASTHAQTAPEAVKSADQITCELTGACGEADAGPIDARGETRGFSIARAPSAAHVAQHSAPNGTAAAKLAARLSIARPAYYAAPTAEAALPGHRQRLIAPTHKLAGAIRPAITGSSNLAVGFALDSSTLDSAGRMQAEALLAALRGPGLAGKYLIIAGHTDSTGGREYNIDLSQRRARALVDYLAINGVSRTLLDPIGYGYDRPLAGLSAGEPRNRRVEVVMANQTRP